MLKHTHGLLSNPTIVRLLPTVAALLPAPVRRQLRPFRRPV
jgi:hypothetical protein